MIDTAIAVYGGRIFELEPERMRAEFTSPLAAVCCAVEIQEALARRMADVPPPARIRLRIGIHYGEALVDRGELTGEALTIARRVHGVTEPGEICVSRTVVEAVKGQGRARVRGPRRDGSARCRRPAWRFAWRPCPTFGSRYRRGWATPGAWR